MTWWGVFEKYKIHARLRQKMLLMNKEKKKNEQKKITICQKKKIIELNWTEETEMRKTLLIMTNKSCYYATTMPMLKNSLMRKRYHSGVREKTARTRVIFIDRITKLAFINKGKENAHKTRLTLQRDKQNKPNHSEWVFVKLKLAYEMNRRWNNDRNAPAQPTVRRRPWKMTISRHVFERHWLNLLDSRIKIFTLVSLAASAGGTQSQSFVAFRIKSKLERGVHDSVSAFISNFNTQKNLHSL